MVLREKCVETAGKSRIFKGFRAFLSTPKPWVAGAMFGVFAPQNAVVDRKTNLLRSEAKYGILLPLPKPKSKGFGFSLFGLFYSVFLCRKQK